MDERVTESLERQADVFATIFQSRGLQLTDQEKKSLSKPPKGQEKKAQTK